MTAAFDMDPAAGILRTVINGDNALHPASQKNVIFDAFGAKVHGMTMQGVVPFSSFGGPYNYQLTYPTTHLSNAFWFYDVTFPQPLAYCPIVIVLYQQQSGAWVSAYSASGGSVTVTGGFAASQAKLRLVTQSSVQAGASASLQPLAVSYRLFGV